MFEEQVSDEKDALGQMTLYEALPSMWLEVPGCKEPAQSNIVFRRLARCCLVACGSVTDQRRPLPCSQTLAGSLLPADESHRTPLNPVPFGPCAACLSDSCVLPLFSNPHPPLQPELGLALAHLSASAHTGPSICHALCCFASCPDLAYASCLPFSVNPFLAPLASIACSPGLTGFWGASPLGHP